MEPDSSDDRSVAVPRLTLLDRAVQYGQAHGGAALARYGVEVVHRTALKYAALATYYPSVAAEALRWKLRPSQTVMRVVDGELSFPSGRFAVFLVFQPQGTPWYVENALAALAAARINVLLVFNHPLEEARLDAFRRASFRVMVRNNAGLDIGGYRDGYLSLCDDAAVQRLLLLNDSVYFFAEGLASFFERLMASEADVCAPFENRQFHYHIQSFCLSLSRRTMCHEAVRRFFADYIPVNSRRWAIHRGELGLSAALKDAARDIEILYPAERLAAHPGPLPALVQEDGARFLPIALRNRFEWMRRQPGIAAEPLLATVVRLAGNYSQIHTAGFLFRALLGAPLMKRDLVFREQFTGEDVRHLLAAIGDEGHLEAILADLGRKGDGRSLRGLQRGRYVAGMI